LLVSTDVKGYGTNDERSHIDIQRALLQVVDEAAEAAGLDRSTWTTQGAGDGELAILPPEVREADVVDDYVAELRAALEHHNHGRLPESRLRLRLAIHFGSAIPAANGYAGHGVVLVSRLVDSAPAKQALVAAPDACLAVILSDQVYTDTVLQRHTKLRPASFRQVAVQAKETSTSAWLLVPDTDTHALDLTPPAPTGTPAAPGATAAADATAGRDSRPEPAPAMVFRGRVTAPGAVFGVNNGTVNNSTVDNGTVDNRGGRR
jgi:hypothetical protein